MLPFLEISFPYGTTAHFKDVGSEDEARCYD